MQELATQPSEPARRRLSAPIVLLGILILGYAVFFGAYAVQRHNTLNTSVDGISAADQAMWNTLHGRLLLQTVGAVQVPRAAEHFEPVLVPLSLVYLAWNDVRAVLILQALVLALGALPVFWIARRTFAGEGRRTEWIALAFSLAYLLYPALQAANAAGFHAETLAVTPLLFAFWYGTERRWRAMWAWAIAAMLMSETVPALAAMLGLYFILSDGAFRNAWRAPGRTAGIRLRSALAGDVKHGVALLLVSLAWFVVANFVIVAPLARRYYGAEASVYPADLGGALALLREPARLDYLKGLFGPVGWLALLAPEVLLAGLPLLLANTLSSIPAQNTGQGHYAAALVPVIIVAAIYGARRLQRFAERQVPFRLTPYFTNAAIMSTLVAAWLLFSSVAAQVDRGWTPLARPFQWPAAAARQAALARLAGQIPPGAAVSATPAVHPHLAHREKVYVFPELGDAEYALVDVAGVTGMGAGELKANVDRLLAQGGYGVVDAADGFLLLGKGRGGTAIPADFYTFARAADSQPEVPLQAQFGPALQFLGYDPVDDPRSRLTRFRLYFRRVSDGPLPADLAIRYTARDQAGGAVDDSDLRPAPAALWYPPARWGKGETVIVETPAAYLPRAFAPVLSATAGGQALPAQVTQGPVEVPGAQAGAPPTAEVAPDGSLRLPGLARRDGMLGLYEGPLYPIDSTDASFAGEDWTVRLREWSAPMAVAPGQPLTVLLFWQAARPAPKDYEVFLELRDATGVTVAATSGQPAWFTPRPASAWQVKSDGLAGVIDAHTIQVPAGVDPGSYDVVAGWQDAQAGKRLSRVEGFGNRVGDEFVLGAVTVDPLAGPRPDACCAAAKECCASNE